MITRRQINVTIGTILAVKGRTIFHLAVLDSLIVKELQ